MGLDELPFMDPQDSEFLNTKTGELERGRLVDKVSDTEYMMVLWDLHELNWRADFTSLHRRLAPPENPLPVWPMIASINVMLASSSGWGVHTDDIEDALPTFEPTDFDGDSPCVVKDRAIGLVTVCKLMSTWRIESPINPPDEIYPSYPFDGMAYVSLEREVAEAYCATFKKHNNRHPISPAEPLPYELSFYNVKDVDVSEIGY